MDKTNSILFSDLEELFPYEILEGEVSACKRILINTDKGILLLQVGDTEEHYSVELNPNL